MMKKGRFTPTHPHLPPVLGLCVCGLLEQIEQQVWSSDAFHCGDARVCHCWRDNREWGRERVRERDRPTVACVYAWFHINRNTENQTLLITCLKPRQVNHTNIHVWTCLFCALFQQGNLWEKEKEVKKKKNHVPLEWPHKMGLQHFCKSLWKREYIYHSAPSPILEECNMVHAPCPVVQL